MRFYIFFQRLTPTKKHSKKPTCLSEYRLCFQLNLSKTNMDFSVLPKKYYYNTTHKAIIPDMRSCAWAFCGFSQENILISLVPFFFFSPHFFVFYSTVKLFMLTYKSGKWYLYEGNWMAEAVLEIWKMKKKQNLTNF